MTTEPDTETIPTANVDSLPAIRVAPDAWDTWTRLLEPIVNGAFCVTLTLEDGSEVEGYVRANFAAGRETVCLQLTPSRDGIALSETPTEVLVDDIASVYVW